MCVCVHVCTYVNRNIYVSAYAYVYIQAYRWSVRVHVSVFGSGHSARVRGPDVGSVSRSRFRNFGRFRV